MQRGKRKKVTDADLLPVRKMCNHNLKDAIETSGLYECPDCGEDVTIEYLLWNESTDYALRQQLVEVIKDHE